MSGSSESKRRRANNFTTQEVEYLLKLVQEHKTIIEDKRTNNAWMARKAEAWEKVSQAFNAYATTGMRTPGQLKNLYDNKKQTAKKMILAMPGGEAFLSDDASMDESLASHEKDSSACLDLYLESLKKSKSYFREMLNSCTALVVQHGRPAELLDDRAFRDILDLIPLTKIEKERLTSDGIKDYINKLKKIDGGYDSYKNFHDVDCKPGDEDRDCDNDPLICNVVESSIGHQNPVGSLYWTYFELSTGSATCKLCQMEIRLTSISDLKLHMSLQHANVPYLDNDTELTADPRPELPSNTTLPTPTLSPAKSPSKEEESNLPSTTKRQKRAQTEVTLKTSETIPLEEFETLDRFGLYVASLMKLLPEEKCLSYQEQIIHTVIQAAAG